MFSLLRPKKSGRAAAKCPSTQACARDGRPLPVDIPAVGEAPLADPRQGEKFSLGLLGQKLSKRHNQAASSIGSIPFVVWKIVSTKKIFEQATIVGFNAKLFCSSSLQQK